MSSLTSEYRFRILLVAQIALLLAYPYGTANGLDSALLHAFAAFVLLAGLWAVSSNRRHLTVGALLAGAAVLSDALAPSGTPALVYQIGLVFEVAFYGLVLTLTIREVFRSNEGGDTDSLAGAVCVYMLFGLAFASAYTFVESVVPGSFHLPDTDPHHPQPVWANLLFFSYTALTTVGYGDITPVTHTARSLATVESTTGVLYTAIMVARLVSLVPQSRAA